MATWRDGIAYTLEATFGDDPFAASPTWTDISSYLCPWTLQFGRTSESNEFSPSILQFQLRNDDRRFDPDHAAGPYFGDLVPMVRVKLTVTYSAADRVIFDGFALGWPQEWDRKIGNVRVTATDGTRLPENAPLASSAYACDLLADEPDWYFPAQDLDNGALIGSADVPTARWPSRIPGTNDAAEVSDQTLPLGDTGAVGTSDSSQLLSEWREEGLAPFGGDIVRTQAPVGVSFWAKGSTVATAGFAVDIKMAARDNDFLQVQVTDEGYVKVNFIDSTIDESISGSFDTVTVGEIGTDRMHHIAFTVDTVGSTYATYVDGRIAKSGSLVSDVEVLSGVGEYRLRVRGDAAVSHVALWWDSPPSEARILAQASAGYAAYGHPFGERSGDRIARGLDEIGWPSTRRSIDTGVSIQGPYLPNSGQALDYIRQVEQSEQGMFYFSRTGDAKFIDRQSLASAADSGEILSDDATAGDIAVAEVRPDGNSITTVRNIVTASHNQTRSVTRKDAASITSYLEERESIESPTLASGEAAGALCDYVLRLRADPLTRIPELAVDIREDPADHIAVLDLDIGDVATFEWTPMNVGSALSKRLMVQGGMISSDDETFMARLYLSPAAPSVSEAPYLELGDATYGKIGVTAGNIIVA